MARAAVGHGLNGVDHEVLEDLPQLLAIGEKVAGPRRHRDDHFSGGAGGRNLRSLLEHVDRREDGFRGRAALGEVQELLGQRLGRHAGRFAVLKAGIVAGVLGE